MQIVQERFLLLFLLLAFACSNIRSKKFLDASTPFGFFFQINVCGLLRICPEEPASAKEIKAFYFRSPTVNAKITGSEITLVVPYSTDVTKLIAGFIISGDKIKIKDIEQISEETVNDFSNPLTYTVIATDGTSKDYLVQVLKAQPFRKEITSFEIINPPSSGYFAIDNKIKAYLPYGTNLSSLIGKFSTTGEKVEVKGVTQISGITANDFSNPVQYIVKASDGSSLQYTVEILVGGASSKELFYFEIKSLNSRGGISGTNINFIIPYDANPNSLIPSFSTNGSSVKVSGTTQISGVNLINFSSPVVYSVFAADGSFTDYTVSVSKSGSSSKDILSYKISSLNMEGVIDEANSKISLVAPYGSDLSTLVSDFTTNAATVKIESELQVSGLTVNSFYNPITYTTYAFDGTTKDYLITTTFAPAPVPIPIPPSHYTIAASVSGLTSGTLSLQNNGADTLNITANGSATFFTSLVTGTSYSITISNQPVGHSCSLSNASGMINNANVTVIATCVVTPPSTYTVTASVTGLTSGTFSLQNNGANTLNIATNGNATFPTALANGTNYNVTISSQPAGHSCSISSASGTISSANVTVAVTCLQYLNVAGTITGLSGSGFELQMTGTIPQTINLSSGTTSYTFPTALLIGSNYNVSVSSQPTSPWQTCSLSGTTSSASISANATINVSCTTNTYSLQGNFSGTTIKSGLQISNGISTTSVNSGATSFITTGVNSGSTYTFTIAAQPEGQTCAIIGTTSQIGNIAGTNLTGFDLNCVDGVLIGGNRIQKLPPAPLNIPTYQGDVTVFSSTGFNTPNGITYDGNNFYLSDSSNHVVKQINPSGTVTHTIGTGAAGFADGAGTTAQFNNPRGITTDGTFLYLTESDGKRIRKIKIGGDWDVSTIAGDTSTSTPATGDTDGIGTSARFADMLSGLATDGNYLYVADRGNGRIRKVELSNIQVTTFTTGLTSPGDIAIAGSDLYVAEIGSHTIKKISIGSGTGTVIAGGIGNAGKSDGLGTNAMFVQPHGIITDGANLFVSEFGNDFIRRVQLSDFMVFRIAGEATGSLPNKGVLARFQNPNYLTSDGKSIFISENGSNRIDKLTDFGLVGYYPLTNFTNATTQPTTLYSYVEANTNNLTNNGATMTTGVHGEVNGAMSFNGSSYLSVNGTPSGVTGNNTRSLCAWVNPNSLPVNGDRAYIVSYGGTGGSIYSLYLEKNSFIDQINQPTGNFILPVGSWSHICIQYYEINSSNRVRMLYVNGNLIKRTITTGGFTTLTNRTTIGCKTDFTQCFNGKIADVRIYSRILNVSEINMLSENGGAQGLIAGYQFDNLLTTTDSGPTGLALTETGSPTSIIGKDGDVNGAQRLDGTQYYTANHTGIPSGSNAKSFCVWVSPYNYPTTGNSYEMVSAGSVAVNTKLAMKNIGGVQSIYFEEGASNTNSQIALPLNTWSHVCGVYDNSNMKLYYNGNLISTTSSITLSTGTTNLKIGTSLSNTNFFQGKIDDVRIYNNVLSEAQIRRLASQVPEGLVARYDFNGDANDVSGFGQNPTSNNATTTSDRFGQSSSAYSFNGNQAITVPVVNLKGGIPLGGNDRTICGWMKATSIPVSGNNASLLYYGGSSSFSNVALKLGDISGTPTLQFNATSSLQKVNYRSPINNWNYLCGSYTNHAPKIYFNGAQLTLSGSNPNIWNTVLDDLNLGASNANFASGFVGSLDDLRIYNRVLTLSEIQTLSGYHPLQVTNAETTMKLHLQADTLNQTNGTAVTTWVDSSFVLNDVTQATVANQPTYSSTGLNTKPSLFFDGGTFAGTGDYMQKTGFTAPVSNFLSFTVFNPSSIDFRSLIAISPNSPTAGACQNFGHTVYIRNDSHFVTGECGSGSSFSAGSPVSTGNNYIGYGGYNGSNFFSSFFLSNGTLASANGAFSHTLGSSPYDFKIGISTNTYHGYISEILYFSNYLSTSDQTLVNCYLSAKYGLTVGSICP